MIGWTSCVEDTWFWDGQDLPKTTWTLQTIDRAKGPDVRFILTVLVEETHYHPRKTKWLGLFYDDKKVVKETKRYHYQFIGRVAAWRYFPSFGCLNSHRQEELLDRWLERWLYEFVQPSEG